MNDRSISALVVATGSGEPLRSSRPKPLHRLCGRAMGSYVINTIGELGVRRGVVVTGREGGRVAKRLAEDEPRFPIRFVEQSVDLGTGESVLAGLSGFDDYDDEEDLLIVPSDLPLLRAPMLRELLRHHRESNSACTVLALELESQGGFDRIVRDHRDRISSIEPATVEVSFDSQSDFVVGARHRADTDASEAAAKAGDEVEESDEPLELATGVYCIRRGLLAPALRRVSNDGRAAEIRLSGVVEVLAESGHTCESLIVSPVQDLSPIGSRLEIAEAEAELRRRTNLHWMSMGVTMVDPDRTYIDATVKLGTDVTLFPGTMLQGGTTVGDGCEIGPEVRLDRCQVGCNTTIQKATGRLAIIGDDCKVGPFAVLDPGAEIESGTETGPFYAEGTAN